MAALFDKNGNATETHIATVSSFAPVTGEFKATYDVRILAGTGIPAYSTLTLAPVIQSGFAACWNGVEWVEVTDFRGDTAYNKSDGTPQIIKSLGKLDNSLTNLEPSTPYDQWDGSRWVTDMDAQHAADIAAAEQTKQNFLAIARSTISIWQTELQLGTIDDEDKASLIEWLAYIKEVQAVITSSAPHINWPTSPVG